MRVTRMSGQLLNTEGLRMTRIGSLATMVVFFMLTILSRQAAAGTATPAELITATAGAVRAMPAPCGN